MTILNVWASYPPVLLIRQSSPPASPTACPCRWHFLPSWTQCSPLSTLSPDRQIEEDEICKNTKSTRTWQRFNLRLKRLAALAPDLFEGVHLGGEVRRLEHAQQRVQPQVVHHSHQFPLEPHAQQLDGRQQVGDADQTLT